MLRDLSDSPFLPPKKPSTSSQEELIPNVELTASHQSIQAADKKKPISLPLSINQVTTFRWSFDDSIFGLRESGIDSVGIWLSKFLEFGEEKAIELVQWSGLNVSSLGWTGGFTGANGQSFEDSLRDAHKAIKWAKLLNSDSLTIISGAQNGHIKKHALRLLMEGLKWLSDEAAEQGISLAILPMHPIYSDDWTFLNALEPTLEVIDACRNPALGLCFHSYHLWQEEGLLSQIPQLVPYLKNVKLSDWADPPTSQHNHALPGEGVIPLVDILRATHQNGYQGKYEIEVWADDVWKNTSSELLVDCKDRFSKLWQAATQ